MIFIATTLSIAMLSKSKILPTIFDVVKSKNLELILPTISTTSTT
jgi:hypothetical protein